MSQREPGTSPPEEYLVARGSQKPLPATGTVFSAAAGADKAEAGRGVPHGEVRFAAER
jgi:hypothetical protein